MPERETLPDRLGSRLELILVGINPSLYAVARGHYFARPQNRFWPAFSASRLGQPICRALGVERLRPEHDLILPEFGIGLTDVVKIPSVSASSVTPEMYREGVPQLCATLRKCRPRVVAFHGMTGFRPFLRYGLGSPARPDWGLQPQTLEGIPLYVLPNPSGANAHFKPSELVAGYDRLAEFLVSLRG
ncbi:MAG: mismatch-specific DNA-glycosylase [Candidatus Eremiobacteraeota bacterium]|nr:mismatch-specific DNA-glycosylase [Candidatus Eremiobacteraeota bacterium]MCW5866232.1 mismatch-specific DNA-glycosylase [Candidatus Eremiobacteraeota bacterium]